MISGSEKKDVLGRIKKIEGQVRGISRMVDEDRYCMDILQQTSAVHEALRGIEKIIMKGYLETCVTDAIRQNKKSNKIYSELMDVIYKYAK
jgi:DNA-binding FrmR family transcriptional regulator